MGAPGETRGSQGGDTTAPTALRTFFLLFFFFIFEVISPFLTHFASLRSHG